MEIDVRLCGERCADVVINDYNCKLSVVESNPELLSNKFFKAITQMLDKNELDELLAEHGYVNRDNLIGGGL